MAVTELYEDHDQLQGGTPRVWLNFPPKGLQQLVLSPPISKYVYFSIHHNTVQHQYSESLAVRGKSIYLFVLIGT